MCTFSIALFLSSLHFSWFLLFWSVCLLLLLWFLLLFLFFVQFLSLEIFCVFRLYYGYTHILKDFFIYRMQCKHTNQTIQIWIEWIQMNKTKQKIRRKYAAILFFLLRLNWQRWCFWPSAIVLISRTWTFCLNLRT